MFNKEAAAITGSWWLSLNWSDIDLTFKNAFYLAFYGTWFDPVTASQQFNSNLGTLFIEIMASFLVYSMIVYFRMVGAQLCHRVSIYILVSIFTFYYFNGNLDFFVFIAGAMLADFSVNYRKFFEVVSRVRWFILSLGVFFATANIGNIPYSEASAFNLYHSVEVVFRSIGIHPLSGPWAIAAVLLLLSLFSFKSLQVFFEKDFIQFLGTHSYSIYLIHTIVIGSFSSGLFVFCHRFCSLDYNSTVFFVFCLTAFVVVMLSHVLLFVDKKAVAISRLC
jgi:peptidoglycan/LPS O-acetylase OafA/YrhL